MAARPPNYLHIFADDARKRSRDPNEPPNAISAGALDKNFRACSPVEQIGNNVPYKVVADEKGWQLQPTLVFDVCENAKPVRVRLFGVKIPFPEIESEPEPE
jgi:hypothetical protein